MSSETSLQGKLADIFGDLALARRMLAGEFAPEPLDVELSARLPEANAFSLAGPYCPAGARPEDAREFSVTTAASDRAWDDGSHPGLHAAIYRARQDVNAIAFMRTSSVIALAAHTSPLATYYQYGGLFFGATERLSLACDLETPDGEMAMIASLGRNRALFVAGWGAINVSDSLANVTVEAQCLLIAANRQLQALKIGGAPMSDAVAGSYRNTYHRPSAKFRDQLWLAGRRRYGAEVSARSQGARDLKQA